MRKLEKEIGINKADLENGRRYYEFEQVKPTNRNIFLSFLYSIIAQREHFTGLKQKIDSFVDNGLTNPEAILSNKKKVKKFLNSWESKYKGMIDVSRWFIDTSIDYEIIRDAKNGRHREFELRNQIAEEAPMIFYKSASLIMMKHGYQNVVPLDIHAMDFLYGYLKKSRQFSRDWNFLMAFGGKKVLRNSINTRKQYISSENIFSDIASSLNVSPAVLQSAIYIKTSKESRFLNEFKE